jgi:hypothetical protein
MLKPYFPESRPVFHKKATSTFLHLKKNCLPSILWAWITGGKMYAGEIGDNTEFEILGNTLPSGWLLLFGAVAFGLILIAQR